MHEKREIDLRVLLFVVEVYNPEMYNVKTVTDLQLQIVFVHNQNQQPPKHVIRNHVLHKQFQILEKCTNEKPEIDHYVLHNAVVEHKQEMSSVPIVREHQ